MFGPSLFSKKFLNAIDATAAWRVEAERPIMELAPDWLEQEVVEGEQEVTPPTSVTGRGRGLPPLAPGASDSGTSGSRAQESPLPALPVSSSKGKVVTFSRKRGKGN